MRIIPAIDIINGKCVRLTQGRFSEQKQYDRDPVDMARQFQDHGIQHVHVVDLDGAREGSIKNYKTLERIAAGTDLQVDFGGGMGSDEDVRIAFESGASQVTGGSIAVKDEALFTSWLKNYGAGKIILGADALDGKIAVSGWQDTTEVELIPFIQQYVKKGVQYVICTDISKDGMMQGPGTDIYTAILDTTKKLETRVTMSGVEDEWVPGIHLIASGGITSMQDIVDVENAGCEGAIIGKAIYENKISLKELENYILGTWNG